MGIYSIKPVFQKTLQPLANIFIKFNIHPTILNFLALFISIISGLLLFFHKDFKFFLLIIPFCVFFRIAFNALDGMVARGLKISSSKGEVYNEFFDRLSDVVIFLGLTLNNIFFILNNFYFYDSLLLMILGFVSIIIILLNSYLGILSKSAGGKRIYIGLIGKADRMFYLGLTGLIYFFYSKEIVWNIFFLFLIAGTIISIGQRLWTIVKSLKN